MKILADPPLARTADPAPAVPGHYLYPGSLFVSAEPCLVTTILGSCVAVCLWDPVRRVGGINHFLLPLWNGEGLPTPRYGNVAIDALIEKMAGFGCAKAQLKAKVFGGASMWANPGGLFSVGERNVALAKNWLHANGIPIVGSDLGGETGRKLIFHTANGEVMLRRHRQPAS